MIAVAYLRVSTEEQALGLEAQRAAIVAWAAREGADVTSWHEDAGRSGSLDVAGRPGLEAALGAVRAAGKGTVLVVAKRDRLARNVLISIGIQQEIRKLGAVLVFADGSPGYADPMEDPMGWIMARLSDDLAEWERHMIRHRTHKALQAKRASGRLAGQVPYGYRAVGGELLPVNEELGAMQRAAQLRADGWTFAEIAGALETDGVRLRSGAPVTASAVHGWLRNMNGSKRARK